LDYWDSNGGISIFANNIADIQKVISPCYLNQVLFLLAVSVSSGIFYPHCISLFVAQLDSIIDGIDISFSDEKIVDWRMFLNGRETFEEVPQIIKEQCLSDLSYLLPFYIIRIDANAKTSSIKVLLIITKKK